MVELQFGARIFFRDWAFVGEIKRNRVQGGGHSPWSTVRRGARDGAVGERGCRHLQMAADGCRSLSIGGMKRDA